jgi:dienelactone hydrolase
MRPATLIPQSPGVPIVSVSPVKVAAPARGEALQLRVTAPATGDNLPVIVFSHGYGGSMQGYAPLVDAWAAHGFVVVQPTHLDSHSRNLAPEDPRTPDIWRLRIADLRQSIDQLAEVLTAVPGLSERTSPERLAIAGHSWGATSASALIGATVLGADGIAEAKAAPDPRIRAALLLCLAGTGAENLTPFAAQNFAFMNPGFDAVTTPALMVGGDHDQSMLSSRGPDWWTDGYRLSPAPKSLLTLFGAEHSLGGISGYGVAETTDESPARVALIQALSTAYLQSALGLDPDAWSHARSGLAAAEEPLGRIESK